MRGERDSFSSMPVSSGKSCHQKKSVTFWKLRPTIMNKNRMTDEQLMGLAKAGDETAYKHILERYVPPVAGYFAGKADRSATEDLVQEVFMSAFQNIHTLRSSGKLGPWLLGIARNKLNDFYRSRGRDRALEDALNRGTGPSGRRGLEIADSSPNPSERAQANQLETFTMKSLGELKDAYRVILYLRLFEELSYVEIANRLGLKDGTVRIRARRGFQSLRRKLVQQGITPEYLEGGLT